MQRPFHGDEVSLDREGLNWTSDDVAYLEACAGKMPAFRIAQHLRRCVEAVHQKASKLNLSLVTRVCMYGHELEMRPNGRYVCKKCHAIRERKQRRKAK